MFLRYIWQGMLKASCWLFLCVTGSCSCPRAIRSRSQKSWCEFLLTSIFQPLNLLNAFLVASFIGCRLTFFPMVLKAGCCLVSASSLSWILASFQGSKCKAVVHRGWEFNLCYWLLPKMSRSKAVTEVSEQMKERQWCYLWQPQLFADVGRSVGGKKKEQQPIVDPKPSTSQV